MTAVVTAGVTFAVVMVIAVEVFPELQGAVEVGDNDIADAAFGAAFDLDTGIGQGVDCAAADTAADEELYFFSGEQGRQSAVSGISGREA